MGEVYLLGSDDALCSQGLRKPDISYNGRFLRSKKIEYPRFFVYGWRRNGNYLYIGQTSCGRDRFSRSHRIITRAEKKFTDYIDIWACNGYEEIDIIEKKLIKLFRPIFNKTHNSEGRKRKRRIRKHKIQDENISKIPSELLMKCKNLKELKELRKQFK